jgi:xanthine dehydrogenase accessory factor
MSGHDHDHGTAAGTPLEGWEVLRRAQELSESGEELAVASVVWRQPPSSGKQGSRAVITADGQIHGWIGGACAEPIVIREAKQVIADHEARLLLIGRPGQFGETVPEGMAFRPMTCASEGALQVYVEPVVPTTHLVVVGRSPMAQTLVELARVLGWSADLVDGPAFSAGSVTPRSVVVVATQGHGDEEAVEAAVSGFPAYVGLVASRKRGATVLEFLAERGLAQELVDRVQVPVGLDLGHTTHREIAVAVLAELVQRRAAGEFVAGTDHQRDRATLPLLAAPEAIDPVCGMTVSATDASYPHEHDGTTYWFCCLPCQTKFAANPSGYLQEV